MSTQKPKKGDKKNSSGGSNSTSVDRTLILQVFGTASGNEFAVGFRHQSGMIVVYDPRTGNPLKTGDSKKWRSFDRVVIASQRSHALLVVDCIPDEEAFVELDKETLELECNIRCVFFERSRLELKLVYQLPDDGVAPSGFAELYLDDVFNEESTGDKLYLDRLDSDDIEEKPRTLDQSLAHTLEAPMDVRLDDDDFEWRLGSALDFDLDPTSSDRFDVFFEKFEYTYEKGRHTARGPCPTPTDKDCAYGIGFRATRRNRPVNPLKGRVPVFALSRLPVQDRYIRLGERFGRVPDKWTIAQHPDRDLAPMPKTAPKTDGNPTSYWYLAINDVPTYYGASFWNQHVAEFWRAIDTIEGGRPVSFVPEIVENEEKAWQILYRIEDAVKGADAYRVDITPRDTQEAGSVSDPGMIRLVNRAVWPQADLTVKLKFDQIKTHEGESLTGRTRIRGVKFPQELPPKPSRVYTLDVLDPILSEPRRTVRFGALDVEFGRSDAEVGNTKYAYSIDFHEETVAVRAVTQHLVAGILPGGQDGLPGEEFVPVGAGGSRLSGESSVPCDESVTPQDGDVYENCVEAGFRRRAALVIDLNGRKSSNRFLLDVEEDARPDRTHTIRANLINQVSKAPEPVATLPSVVVLDANPFLVAEVEFVPFEKQYVTKGSIVAMWSNANLEGAGWLVQRSPRDDPATLRLPSQGIGEEMEKGFADRVNKTAPTIKENGRAEFRLGPPAEISIATSDVRRNFDEPAWNLRRILGYPGQRNPGAGIRHLQFELLYGLSCDVNAPFLRLAEISALVGAVPGRLPERPRWRREGDDPMLGEYQEARYGWSRIHRRYLSRVAVLEPWDSHVEGSLVLSENVTCRIRATIKQPLDPTRVDADLASPLDTNPNPQGLQGGVTWGFESKNIYTAVMRAKGDEYPTSTSAVVSNLEFSSLGGWGHQEAAFDENRSKIYGDVALGRTYSYRLERIGRLGVFWNRMKHVIVYERTVVPTKQFAGNQPGHIGRPIVRKVREYLTPLDTKRSYPDGETELTESERAALAKRRGFVEACSFPENAEIPVDGAWGTDVGDVGWKIPLWNAGADPEIYPRPSVFFHLLSDVGGMARPIPHECAEPQNLYFYTDTRVGTSGDPNVWPPVEGVDYVDMPPPAVPKEAFKPNDSRPLAFDDPSIAPGLGPCTIRLLPQTVGVDLVNERAAKPVAAVLETVTMMRGAFKEAALPLDQIKDFKELAKVPGDAAKKLEAVIRDLPDVTELAEGARKDLQDTVRQRIDGLDFSGLCDKVNAKVGEIKNLVKKREAELLDTAEARLRDLLLKRMAAFEAEIREVYNSTDPDNLKLQRLNERIQQNINALEDALRLLTLSPGLLQKLIQGAVGEIRRFRADRIEALTAIVRRVNGYAEKLTDDQLKELKRLTAELIATTDALYAAMRGSVPRSPVPWLPNPIEGLLMSLVDPGGGAPAEPLDAALNRWKEGLRTAILEATSLTRDAALTALDSTNTWMTSTVANLDKASERAVDNLGTWLDRVLDEAIEGGPPLPEYSLAALRKKLLVLDGTLPNLEAKLNVLREHLGEVAAGSASERVNILAQFRKLRETITKQSDDLITILEKAVNETCKQAFAVADDLKARILASIMKAGQSPFREVRQGLTEVYDRVNDAVGDQLAVFKQIDIGSAKWPKEAYAAAGTAITLARAFGKPPAVPNLAFDRPVLAYLYKEASDVVDLTPVRAAAAQASAVADALKPLGVELPTRALAERLLPPDLRNFDLSKILPDFAGLNLSKLFSGLRLPLAANDKIKISHGADAQTRRAWVDASVDFKVEEPATLFSIGPVKIDLTDTRFVAQARIEAGLNEPPKRKVSGTISGNWVMTIGGQPMIIFRKTELKFDDAGGIRFGLDPRNIELPGILSFIQDFLKQFSGSDSGLSIGLLPNGVQALLSLPIPDIQAGAFGMSGLRLGAALRLTFDPTEKFAIAVAFSVGRKTTPFSLTIFILGGGGFLEVETKYLPMSGKISCRVQLAITASASLAVAFGPIKGGVYVYFGITAEYTSEAGGGLTIGVMLLLRGEVSLLGIVEASISLLLEAKYGNGKLIGHGNLSISIKICWCFTLEINEDVTYEVGGGGESGALDAPQMDRLVAANRLAAADPHYVESAGPPGTPDDFDVFASFYIDILSD